MPCYHPVPAYQAGPGAPVRLHPPIGSESLSVPCGRCLGCRAVRATEWARRCVHESSLYEHNCFVTLTYDDEHLPPEGHLDASHLQLFFKRLRKRVAAGAVDGVLSDPSSGVRFFACGEYGGRTGRPHYHSLLFNCNFSDGVPTGKALFVSDTLSGLWPSGNASFGTCTGASANYIAKYSLKSADMVGCDADGVTRPPPFLRMSLKPGIGMPWLASYKDDLRFGYLVDGGVRGRIPRAYRERLKRDLSYISDELEFNADAFRRRAPGDRSDPARLADAEVIHESRKVSAERNSF